MTAAGVAVRFLSRADVVACGGLDMHAAMLDVEEALRLQHAGDAVMPVEVALRWPPLDRQDEAGAYALPAFVGGSAHVAGVKWTVHRPGPAHDGDPRVMGLIVLSDARTGRPFAVMESALIGAVRTAASTGLAIRTLGRAGRHGVTVIGAGLHARTHLRMLAALIPEARRVVVANRTPAHAAQMIDELAHELPWRVHAVELAASAVAASDIVVACTAAAVPFFQAEWVRRGLLAVSVGPFEFTYEAMRAFDAIVVDRWGDFKLTSLKGLFRMYRDGLLEDSAVAADFEDLTVHGHALPATASVFVSLFGLSIFDVAVASRIARVAAQQDIGRKIPLFE